MPAFNQHQRLSRLPSVALLAGLDSNRRALAIDETSFGSDHPTVAIRLNNLAQLLRFTNRLAKAEPLMRRHLAVFIDFERRTGHPHPHRDMASRNYAGVLAAMGKGEAEIKAAIDGVTAEVGARGP